MKRRPAGVLLVVGGLHLVSACWHVLYSGMNSDEGFYAVAARSVWQGDVPYRDFGHTQMPLLPYINGLMMQLTGFGLFEQRAINGLWGALTLALAAIWLSRRTNVYWALGLVAFFSLSAPWMYFIHLGKTYAFAGLVTVAALWVYTEVAPSVNKVSGLALLGAVGVGCRLPSAPYFALLWFAAALELPRHSRKDLLEAAGYSILWPALLVLPFYLAAPEAAIFWTFDFHRISGLTRSWHVPWLIVATLAPALWLGLAGGLLHAVVRRSLPGRRDLVVVAATLATLATNLLPRGAFEEYAVPLLPPLALSASVALWHAGSVIRWLRHGLVPLVLLLANLGLTVALQWPHLRTEPRYIGSILLPPNAPYNPDLPESMARGRAVVKRYLPPDRPFVGPLIILAVETGHRVPHNLRMGAFSLTSDFAADKARRLNLATIPELEGYLTDPAMPLLAWSKTPDNNYLYSMPTFHSTARDRSFPWNKFLQRDFVIAYQDADFLLLVRKNAVPAER